MEKRKMENLGIETSLLGFGCMRFPTDESGNIERVQAKAMMEKAMAAGVNYIDTAYPYHGGESELFVGEVLKEHPRDSFYLATKLPLWEVNSLEDVDRIFNRQLEKLQVEYIDFYLMHALNGGRWGEMLKMGVVERLEQLKAEGKIRYLGFSFHDSYEAFEEILSSRDWDFCQIQYNYMNEFYQAGTAGLMAAAERGLPVIVMEPLLGGKLAGELPQGARKALADADLSDDPVRLALRWVWNHPEVTVVLSGMNMQDQLSQNIETAESALPGSLEGAEADAVEKAREHIARNYRIPCTGCGYCMPCPKGVNIPMCFAAYNTSFAHGWYQGMHQYITASGAMVGEARFASDCVRCGACLEKCPQHIQIPSELTSVKRRLQVPGLPALVRLGVKLMSR